MDGTDHPGGHAGRARGRLPPARHLHRRARDHAPRRRAGARHDVLEPRDAVRRRPLRRRPARRRAAPGSSPPTSPPMPRADWIAASERTGLDRVFLAAPTSTDERLDLIVASVDRASSTPSRRWASPGSGPSWMPPPARLVGRMRCARQRRRLRACVGIGISNADQVAGVLEYADGAIVGTALVRALRDGGLDGLAETARALSAGTRAARLDSSAHDVRPLERAERRRSPASRARRSATSTSVRCASTSTRCASSPASSSPCC